MAISLNAYRITGQKTERIVVVGTVGAIMMRRVDFCPICGQDAVFEGDECEGCGVESKMTDLFRVVKTINGWERI
jgi:hypothetical protein